MEPEQKAVRVNELRVHIIRDLSATVNHVAEHIEVSVFRVTQNEIFKKSAATMH